MSDRFDNNRNAPDNGGFKVQINERDLAAGYSEPAPRRRGSNVGYAAEPVAAKKAYLTEEERKAEKKAHKKRNRLKARKNKRIFSIMWLCMVVLLSLTLATYLTKGTDDFFAVGRNEGTAEIEIPENVTEEQLAQILHASGAVAEPEFFELYCKVTANMENFEAGSYTVETNLDYEALINNIQWGNTTREEVTVTFREGLTALEMAALLEENEVCSADEFLTALNSGDFTNYTMIGELGDTTGRYYELEGYLFPDTYNFYKDEDIESVIGKMLYNFQNKFTDELKEMLQNSGYTMDEIVILASIIQAEAANSTDMFDVSAVLHNRMNFGAEYGIYRLECDSTCFYPYAHQSDIPETGALSYGAYDTYQIEGLPAGAICNPGYDAILAALSPSEEAGSYLYFCHSADGTAYYATNANDHAYNLQLAGLVE